MKQVNSIFQAFLTILCAEFSLIWFFTPQSLIFQLCREGSSCAEPALGKDECLAQGHNADALVRLKPTTPLS